MSIPDNAVGFMAASNSSPEEYIGSKGDAARYRIVSRSSYTMVLEQVAEVAHSGNTYLGVICSKDFSVSYWVNNTRPLP